MEEENTTSAQLSPSKLTTLRLLKIRGETKLSDLARMTSVSNTGVLMHIMRLEEEGLIERNSIHGGEKGRADDLESRGRGFSQGRGG